MSRVDGWHLMIDIYTAKPMALQCKALEMFWPGLQIVAGDLRAVRISSKRHAYFANPCFSF